MRVGIVYQEDEHPHGTNYTYTLGVFGSEEAAIKECARRANKLARKTGGKAAKAFRGRSKREWYVESAEVVFKYRMFTVHGGIQLAASTWSREFERSGRSRKNISKKVSKSVD